jgi:hypothetical protein
MNDTELYAKMLDLQAPWQVNAVDFNPQQRAVTVFVVAAPDWQWHCPHCGQPVSRYDKRHRQWRHLAEQMRTTPAVLAEKLIADEYARQNGPHDLPAKAKKKTRQKKKKLLVGGPQNSRV